MLHAVRMNHFWQLRPALPLSVMDHGPPFRGMFLYPPFLSFDPAQLGALDPGSLSIVNNTRRPPEKSEAQLPNLVLYGKRPQQIRCIHEEPDSIPGIAFGHGSSSLFRGPSSNCLSLVLQLEKARDGFFAFTKKLIAFRKEHPLLGRETFLSDVRSRPSLPDCFLSLLSSEPAKCQGDSFAWCRVINAKTLHC
jgi:hypothetical protein